MRILTTNSAVIITAAGKSNRMGSNKKKEYLPLYTDNPTISLLSACLFAFLQAQKFSYILVTVPKGEIPRVQHLLSLDKRLDPFFSNESIKILITEGGKTRQASVYNALKQLKDNAPPLGYVLIHDGARPWISQEVITKVFTTMQRHGSAVPSIATVDTQKEVNSEGIIVQHLHRESIVSVQTPQGFLFDNLYVAHTKAEHDEKVYTDDSEIYATYIAPVYICEGCKKNKKVTYKEDVPCKQYE